MTTYHNPIKRTNYEILAYYGRLCWSTTKNYSVHQFYHTHIYILPSHITGSQSAFSLIKIGLWRPLTIWTSIKIKIKMEGLVSLKATLPSFTHRPNKFSIRRSIPGPTMDLHTRKPVSFASSSIRAQQVLTFLLIFSFTTSSLQSSHVLTIVKSEVWAATILYHL